jgi:hypothetical protein
MIGKEIMFSKYFVDNWFLSLYSGTRAEKFGNPKKIVKSV